MLKYKHAHDGQVKVTSYVMDKAAGNPCVSHEFHSIAWNAFLPPVTLMMQYDKWGHFVGTQIFVF